MEMLNFWKRKKKTIINLTLLFLVLGLVFSFSQTFKYGTKSKLLVIQEGSSGVDPFAVSRSVEYLSTLFSQVTSSNSFYDLVMNTDYNIDKNYFAGDSVKKMKTWRKTVQAKSETDSGMIVINVYHPDAYQAKQLSLAVNQVLVNQNANYQGLGATVRVMVIDQPVVSTYPVKPNLVLNIFLSVFFGLIFSFAYSYIFPEEKDNFSFRKRKKAFQKNENYPVESSPAQDIYQAPKTAENKNYENKGNIDNILRF